MTSNYYTILAQVRELASTCVGWKVFVPYTQRRNELVLPVGPDDLEPTLSIILSCEPTANFLVFKQAFSRASRNSADIFAELAGSTISGIDMHPTDRLAAITLDSGTRLVIRFFGSRSNIMCADASGTIVGTFLRSRDEPESFLLPFPSVEIRTATDSIRSRAISSPDMTIEKALRADFPMLGPVLVREVLFRGSIDETAHLSDLPESGVRTIDRILSGLLEDLTGRPIARIIFQQGEPVHFSLVPLHHLPDTTDEEQSSISKGILRFLSRSRTRHSFLSRKRDVQKGIAEEIERTRRSSRAIERAIVPDVEIDLMEQNGKIIHLHLSEMMKGMTMLDVLDPFSGDERLRSIPLDPLLSPVKNAQRYFEKAKKARNRQAEAVGRRRDLSATLERLTHAEAELEAVSRPADLETVVEKFGDVIPKTGRLGHAAEKKDPRPPFRIYRVEGGFEVWVGKSSANNDLLTTRHTAKNDLWFHARGVGGSHVVLKAGSGKGEISKKARYATAAIAAHFSKMKNAKHVAVSMCLGKFVRKPRKAQPGTVVIEREEVLFVDPALPPNEE